MSRSECELYLALAALGALLLGFFWLVGGIAGALFGEGWPSLDVGQLAATALRFPSHLGDPRVAWPRRARGELPGAIGFYASAALICGSGIGAAMLLTRAPIELPRLGGKRRPPAARWASRRDLAPLRVKGPQPGRLILGRSGRSLLAAEERQSVIVFAPTETHKTSGLAIPVLLEWPGPVLVTSVKGDLLSETVARREQLGRVMVFDPAQVSGMEASRATPLWGASSWHGAGRVAHWLCQAARTANGGPHDADFWFATAEKLLAPMLFAAASAGRTMADVVRWLDEGPEANEMEVEELLGEAGEPGARRAWQAPQNREERQRSSVYTTAEMAVAAFADPRVVEETAGADYTPGALLDGGANTLYLCAPNHEQERLRPLFAMLVQELLAVAYESAAIDKKRLDPPLLLLLDEAANVAPIPNLDQVASTGAGQGIQLLSIFQDMAQVGTCYGRRAPTIVNNHSAKVFGIGISDTGTLDYVSRLVGAGEFEQRSRNTGEQGRRSVTEGETYRDLAPASVVRQRDPGTALLIYKHLPPTKISLRLWFEDKELRRLHEGELAA
jgi:type IV secretion system protein VirD4